MVLQFLGADREVTGSCHYVKFGDKHFLVDCGMEQGPDLYVNQEIPVNAATVDYVFVTHAHIDHIAGAQGLADGVSIGHVAYHRADDIVVEHIPDMCKMFGVPVVPMPRRTDDLA